MSEFVWGRRKSQIQPENQLAKDIKKLAELPQLPITTSEMAPPTQEKFLIHRSAILTYKACPYKAYLEYWYKGHGVVSFAMPQHLLIGVCVHRGLQHLLDHCRVEHPNGDFTEKCIDDSVMWAHEVYKEILSKREIELKKVWLNGSYQCEDLNYTIREIYNLIEALIRAFAAFRLKSFLEEYEVLETEKEEEFESFSDIVTWLGKADALLRRKIDNELIVLSIKTAAEFGHFTMSNILIDMQGCSEIVAVEDRLNRYKKMVDNYGCLDTTESIKLPSGEIITYGLWNYLYNQSGGIKVFANQYEYLVKGKHRADKDEPLKFKYQTHLLHPIKSDSMAVAQLGSGLRFGSPSSSRYEWVIPQGRLPKGKRKIDIYETDANGTMLHMSIKQWIDMLARGQVQPEEGSPFQDVIIGGEERLAKRSLHQLREWRISTQFEAEEIASYVNQIENLQKKIEYAGEAKREGWMQYQAELLDVLQTRLMQYFSRDGKDSQLCFDYYGGKCPFTEHCHGGLHIDDGLESGLYIVREPHHDMERKRFIEKGYLKEDENDTSK